MMKIIALILTLILTIPVGNVNFRSDKKEVEHQEKIELYEGAIEDMDNIAETESTGDGSLPTHYDTYLEAYYRGLTQNFAHNYQNSCGYVAMGMLLSYYDTYLCDDIIPESYDVRSEGSFLDGTNMIARNNSPGILYDDLSSYSNIGNMDYEEFKSIMELREDYSFFAYLFLLASDIYMPDEEITITENSNGNLGLTNADEREAILNKYFEEIGYEDRVEIIREADTSGNSESQSNIKAFIKQNIDNGDPVMVSYVSGNKPTGHVMVCYDYSGYTIYGHDGYIGFEHSELSGYIREAVVLKFYENGKGEGEDDWVNAVPMFHTHSDNYEFRNGTAFNMSYACYCSSRILTYTTEYRKYEYLAGDSVIYTLPDWVTKIGDYAFYNVSTIQTIKMGDDVLEIGDCAFSGCDSLTSVTLSNSISTIGAGAFKDCTSLRTIDAHPLTGLTPSLPGLPIFPGTNSSPDDWGIADPPSSTNDLPDDLTYIGAYAFYNCISLESIIIGENVTIIDTNAFLGCTSLIEAVFNDPYGWRRLAPSVDISSESLSDPQSAAQELVLFSDTWLKS